MNKTIKKTAIWLMTVTMLVCAVVFTTFQNAKALSATSNKALVASVLDCYLGGQFKESVSASDFRFRTTSVNTFMSGARSVFVPIDFNNNSPTMKCTDLVRTLISNNNMTIPNGSSSAGAVDSFMTSIGYDKDGAETSGMCLSFVYNISGDNYNRSVYTQKICAEEIENGVIKSDNAVILDGDDEFIQFQDAKKGTVTIDCNVGWVGLGGCGKHNFSGEKWDDFANAIKNDLLENGKGDFNHVYTDGTSYHVELDGLNNGREIIKQDSYDAASANYVLSNSAASLMRATRTLTGEGYVSAPVFTEGEQFVMYQNYLVNYFEAEVHCAWTDDQITANSSGYDKVRLYKDGEFKTCYVKGRKNTSSYVGGIDGNKHFGSRCNYSCVVSWLRDSTTTVLPEDPANPAEGANSSSGGSNRSSTSIGYTGTAEELACDTIVKDHVEGKIGAMQWILCPAMDNTRYTASWVDEMTEEWLTMDPDSYSNSTISDVWGYIRNIANVLMVVFLLVVIISQLTGRGIDNYGIKKMLPRLIVMAIIVNLSLYICQIAVDLSNIAGVGLRNMFGTIAINATATDLRGTSFLGTMTVGVFTAAPTIGTAVSVGMTATQIASGLMLTAPVAIGVIIALVVLFLAILVAVAVLFLMLAAREIIIILCIILSPLAFAAFILPNTQNLFKQWWSLFKAALVIFPICGAMSGISYLLRSMAGDMNLNVWGYAVMMILPYLGFFLLPVLLKNALGALGRIGTALTSLGNSIRSGGRQLGQTGMRAAQNTQRYKDLQKEAARRQEQQRVNRVMQRFGNGSDIEQRLQDARNRMNNAQEGTREYNAAQRDLRRAQTDQRQFYEAQQAHYRMEAEQQVAGTSPETLEARALSAQEALEFKNISDQFANASTEQIRVALGTAEDDYKNDRSSNNATRLRAMQSVAMNRGMNSDVLRGLTKELTFDDNNNENDRKILSNINYSNLYKDLTRRELGDELKSAVAAYKANNLSENNTNRLQSIIRAADANGMDEEMLDDNYGLNVLKLQADTQRLNPETGQIEQVATNDAKILDTMAGVNNKIVKQYGTQLGKNDANRMVGMTMNTFADSTGSVKLSEALAGKGVEYLNGTNDDILGYVAEHSMTNGAYSPVLSSDALASIVANTTDEKVLRKAREMYNNMNPDDIRFTGDQLAKYDIETLRQVANRVTPNSQLQRNFVAATNTIANSSELMSRLSPDSRAVFKSIRRGAGINDNLFD